MTTKDDAAVRARFNAILRAVVNTPPEKQRKKKRRAKKKAHS